LDFLVLRFVEAANRGKQKTVKTAMDWRMSVVCGCRVM
jgi:hypothetical protein